MFATSTAGRVIAAVLVAAQAGAVGFLVSRPRAAVAVVLATGAAMQVAVPPTGPGLIFVVLCTYAWLRPARETLWGLGLAIVAAAGPAAVSGRWGFAGMWLAAALLAWSWGALGRAAGERRQAERRRILLEERARIARELHDVLSHTVSVMVVQAAAADDVFEIDPVRARQAVRDTEQAGRQALAELRLFLRTVREDGAEDPAAGPQPGLADLPRLISTMISAGLPVTLEQHGDRELPAGVQLSAYRIVQEALTNTLRHAGAATASVVVRVTTDAIELTVRDDGRGPQTGPPTAGMRGPAEPYGAAGGHGLAGMRERAGLHGGTLEAGPADGAGFLVKARLPG